MRHCRVEDANFGDIILTTSSSLQRLSAQREAMSQAGHKLGP